MHVHFENGSKAKVSNLADYRQVIDEIRILPRLFANLFLIVSKIAEGRYINIFAFIVWRDGSEPLLAHHSLVLVTCWTMPHADDAPVDHSQTAN